VTLIQIYSEALMQADIMEWVSIIKGNDEKITTCSRYDSVTFGIQFLGLCGSLAESICYQLTARFDYNPARVYAVGMTKRNAMKLSFT